ncbi:MAG: CBS domain-containing protein [Nitrospirae bacterium]|nr:CBS domain-containing protein [Nitrospirota bacterium]
MSKYGEEKSVPVKIDISDADIIDAMKDIPGYLDITPGDFKELYKFAYKHALSRITRSVKARDIMTRDVISVEKDVSLKRVAELMARHAISGIPVVKKDKKVVGVISEKDFLSSMGAKSSKSFMRVIAECLKGKGCVAVSIKEQSARDIMTAPAITVGEEATINEIADIFTEKNINRVPVINLDGVLTGIVSRADIVRASVIKDKP